MIQLILRFPLMLGQLPISNQNVNWKGERPAPCRSRWVKKLALLTIPPLRRPLRKASVSASLYTMQATPAAVSHLGLALVLRAGENAPPLPRESEAPNKEWQAWRDSNPRPSD